MTDITNRFKQWLAGGREKAPLGTWLMSGGPATAEALGFSGFDFLVVDMEHVPIEVAGMVGILRTIAGTPAEPVVRLAWNDRVLVKRVLDAGAQTLMFPFIESVEEARVAVAATRYPPAGNRGVAAMHRASRFGAVPDYLKRADAEIAVILQLETPGAIDRLADMAKLPGVDAFFVGPGDLAGAMGLIGQIGHDAVQARIEGAAKAAHAAGKPVGIVGPNPDMVRRFLGYGYDFVAVSSDIALMTGRAAEWMATLSRHVAP